MINTNFNLTAISQRPACSGGPCTEPAPSNPADGFSSGPPASFEPWLMNPGTPQPSLEPAPGAVGNPITIDVPATIEPWLSGQPTECPAVSGRFADKLVGAFGESAVLNIKDDRIAGVEGYLYGGLESVGGDQDWLSGVTCLRLGNGWETSEFGKYELKGNGVSQSLTLRPDGSKTLESSYVDNTFDTAVRTEILTIDREGNMRRENPASGL